MAGGGIGEAALLGAALSAAQNKDPLQGALMGGFGGLAFGAFGGEALGEAGGLGATDMSLGQAGTQNAFANSLGSQEMIPIQDTGTGLFAGLPSPLRVARYHSLIVDGLSAELAVTATTDDGIPMAIEHRTRKLYGVQFHPESVMTQHGRVLLANFARIAGLNPSECAVSDWIEPQPQPTDKPLPFLTW